MGDLVDQCEAWGLVTREPDPHDTRARAWCASRPPAWPGCRRSRTRWRRPKREFRGEVGADVATVVTIGLEAYAGGRG